MSWLHSERLGLNGCLRSFLDVPVNILISFHVPGCLQSYHFLSASHYALAETQLFFLLKI